jgi:four helix bundle protein
MSYKNLEIWKLANELVVEVHVMTLTQLPKFEMYETGSQIRRSSKSVKSNIVEGYGRRVYKQEYIHFLTIAIASNSETIDHLETLFSTDSSQDERVFKSLTAKYDLLGKMIYNYIASIRNDYRPQSNT